MNEYNLVWQNTSSEDEIYTIYELVLFQKYSAINTLLYDSTINKWASSWDYGTYHI